jgi:hypothetical protein
MRKTTVLNWCATWQDYKAVLGCFGGEVDAAALAALRPVEKAKGETVQTSIGTTGVRFTRIAPFAETAPASASADRGPHGYLETLGDFVTGENEGKRPGEILRSYVEARPCRCKSLFCETCCLASALKLRQRLIPVIEKFSSVFMLTLTIDPELFGNDPGKAMEYVKDKRAISNMVRRLRRWGLLESDRYFAVVEWQFKSEMPHWHILVEAKHIPVEKVREAWNRNWPEWEARIALGRPGFGAVRFSAPRFTSPAHAANYATKYLTKLPEHGFPAWVLDQKTRSIHRYSTSRGFWGQRSGDEEAADDVEAVEPDPVEGEAAEAEDEASEGRTIRQAVADCSTQTTIFSVSESVDVDTGEVHVDRVFLASVPMRLADVADDVSPSERDEKGRFLRFEGEDASVFKGWLFGRQRGSAQPAVEDVPF